MSSYRHPGTQGRHNEVIYHISEAAADNLISLIKEYHKIDWKRPQNPDRSSHPPFPVHATEESWLPDGKPNINLGFITLTYIMCTLE